MVAHDGILSPAETSSMVKGRIERRSNYDGRVGGDRW